jgi:hypothetical protein
MKIITLDEWFKNPISIQLGRAESDNCIYKILNIPTSYTIILRYYPATNVSSWYVNTHNPVSYMLDFMPSNNTHNGHDTCLLMDNLDYKVGIEAPNSYSIGIYLKIGDKKLNINLSAAKALKTFKDEAPYVFLFNRPVESEIKGLYLESHVRLVYPIVILLVYILK